MLSELKEDGCSGMKSRTDNRESWRSWMPRRICIYIQIYIYIYIYIHFYMYFYTIFMLYLYVNMYLLF